MSKINLEGFKFIPQSYTATGTASLEDLNVFSLEPKVKQPESVVPIKRIKDGFVQFDKNFFPFQTVKDIQLQFLQKMNYFFLEVI